MTVGIDVTGDPGAQVRRPYGSGDYVFVHFLSDARLDVDGTRRVGRGDCIVWGPDTPSYIAADSMIRNDFLHLSCDLAEPALARYPVAFDTVFHPASTEFVRPLLSAVQREWAARDVHWEQAVELHTCDLMLQLSRTAGPRADRPLTPHADRIRAVRAHVHQRLDRPWTVAEMAERTYLRESQFTALYRRLYHRPPIDDLLHARLRQAAYYLLQSEAAVATVGERVGYPDPSQFSRIFRRHVGCSPRRFRRERRSFPPLPPSGTARREGR